ncbi:DUF2505 domain-containing protein [Pseudonocardia spinosispora]|uniref:DUF2505 domain-containing protein n=1 Tax=Pseudonocardia spinosispora TaxID=103441 RepID=UPI0003FB309A|nr:DUF2505 domain-containing protein [Pseudonocardia spinosispora]
MPRPIRHQSRYPLAAQQTFAELVSREYLEAKLASIGGNNAALLEHASDDTTAKYTLRQGVSRQYLPSAVQKFLSGDLMIERTETWRKVADGRYEGNVAARVKDAPGNIGGTLRLGDLSGAECEFSIDGQARVDIPLFGGKIETAIAEQVVKLMERESRFTAEWLNR